MVRGQKRPIVNIPQVKQDVRASIHNRFDVEVVDAVTGEIKQKAYAENIVLDALWTRLLAPNRYFNHIHYGTGTGTLAATRTSLFTFLGAKAAEEKTLTYNWGNGWISSRKKIQIAPEEHVGSEFKEVGIGYSATSSNLVTHALLKDMNGNTITIVKTDTDVINIYATVFVHWDKAGYTSGASVWEFAHNCFLTEFLVGDYSSTFNIDSLLYLSGAPQFIYGANGVSNITSTEGVVEVLPISLSYDATLKTIAIPVTRLPVGKGNSASGIKTVIAATSIDINNRYKFLPAVSCSLPDFYGATAIRGEALGSGDGSKTEFKTGFPFVSAGAKVYVDGVEQSAGVTVEVGKPESNNNMGRFFKLIETNYGENRQNLNYGYALMPMPTLTSYGTPELGAYAIYENPFYALGIDSFVNEYTKVESSDDMENWTMVSDFVTATVSVGSSSKYHRYWKITNHPVNAYSWRCYAFTSNSITNANVKIIPPPAAGAVITIDYDTETIAKDVNHVFDFALTITLGEKTD